MYETNIRAKNGVNGINRDIWTGWINAAGGFCMKPITFKMDAETYLNHVTILTHDLLSYMGDIGIREGSAPPRHYMQHRNQSGYTKIRQTKANLIITWERY